MNIFHKYVQPLMELEITADAELSDRIFCFFCPTMLVLYWSSMYARWESGTPATWNCFQRKLSFLFFNGPQHWTVTQTELACEHLFSILYFAFISCHIHIRYNTHMHTHTHQTYIHWTCKTTDKHNTHTHTHTDTYNTLLTQPLSIPIDTMKDP